MANGRCLSVLLVERKEFAFLAAEELKITAARMRNKYPGNAAGKKLELQQGWGARGSAAFTLTLIWPKCPGWVVPVSQELSN